MESHKQLHGCGGTEQENEKNGQHIRQGKQLVVWVSGMLSSAGLLAARSREGRLYISSNAIRG